MAEEIIEEVVEADPADVLDLSDEEFAKLPEPSEEAPVEKEKEVNADPEGDKDPDLDGNDKEELGDDLHDLDDPEKPPEGENTDPDKLGEGKLPDDNKNGKPDADVEANKETADVDYKLEYEKLMAPFKANGMDMQAKSVEDALQLMKMGAGFHKKMAALKPNLKQMKLLEKHGLLDEEKLNFLIDVHNKNPEAITKLLKDSNMDPMDIDLKADSDYKPTNRRVSEQELVLDNVLDSIRETPTFQKTLNVVSKDWDGASQKAIATEPQIISVINGHMQDGTFDKVMEQVDYERNLGRLEGVSDFEAYKQVGNALADAGVLYRTNVPPVAPAENVKPTPAKPSKKEVERKKKKRAASPTKGSRTTAEPTFDPLDLSDEDFAKLDINKYINAK